MSYSFPNFEPVNCSMSSSNCCFLTCIQISQEAGEVVWYSHLLENFPQFVVIHTVKGFGTVNEADVLKFLCFFYDSMDIGNLVSGSSAFSKSSLNIWMFSVHVLLKPTLDIRKSIFRKRFGRGSKEAGLFSKLAVRKQRQFYGYLNLICGEGEIEWGQRSDW